MNILIAVFSIILCLLSVTHATNYVSNALYGTDKCNGDVAVWVFDPLETCTPDSSTLTLNSYGLYENDYFENGENCTGKPSYIQQIDNVDVCEYLVDEFMTGTHYISSVPSPIPFPINLKGKAIVTASYQNSCNKSSMLWETIVESTNCVFVSVGPVSAYTMHSCNATTGIVHYFNDSACTHRIPAPDGFGPEYFTLGCDGVYYVECLGADNFGG